MPPCQLATLPEFQANHSPNREALINHQELWIYRRCCRRLYRSSEDIPYSPRLVYSCLFFLRVSISVQFCFVFVPFLFRLHCLAGEDRLGNSEGEQVNILPALCPPVYLFRSVFRIQSICCVFFVAFVVPFYFRIVCIVARWRARRGLGNSEVENVKKNRRVHRNISTRSRPHRRHLSLCVPPWSSSLSPHTSYPIKYQIYCHD